MKVTEIILVSENWKGTETNFLMTVADYLKYVDMDTFDSQKEVADSMIELGRTLGKENDWSELYFAGNKSVAARFCVDDRQLKKFLKGFYNSTDQEAVFDEKRCSGECLNKLAELGKMPEEKQVLTVFLIQGWIRSLNRGRRSVISTVTIIVSWKSCQKRTCC